jgi:predicted lipid-binding transport protein (Tim44 family)
LLVPRRTGIWLILLALLLFSSSAWPGDAWARVGSSAGRSTESSLGSRGSRSAAAPQPHTVPGKPAQPANTSPPASYWPGFGGGLLGGLAGSMLFRNLFGSGFGLLDLLLFAGIVFLVYRLLMRRSMGVAATTSPPHREAAALPASQPQAQPVSGPPPEELAEGDREQGLGIIRQFDPSFDEAKFQEQGMDIFFKIQGAWANRDLSLVRPLLSQEMFRILQGEAERLKEAKMINRLENTAVRSVDITEAWQELGADYITLRIFASMLDYNVDEDSGEVVEGSRSEPVKFDEYWTFGRPAGNNPWQLSAIQQNSET